ncbi:MAG: hypothetical protein L0212_11940, partial [Acidobacteria bacterium]|nr:hypothetical protein [Acidobacteriota bacterium]
MKKLLALTVAWAVLGAATVDGDQGGYRMKLNHVHVNVRDLPAGIEWMSTIAEVRPSFTNERMATFPLGSFT